ncbi:hypothetical protein R80B4_02331 [Fibrobacteres bacterium R8-0-B4]
MTHKPAFRILSLSLTAALLICAGCADGPITGGGSADPDNGVDAYLGMFNPTLRVQASPSNGGRVSAFPPPNSDGTYRYGTVVTVKAVPGSGYAFEEWSGASAAAVDSLRIVMDGRKTLVAKFRLEAR